jgi:hypothetical protein
LVFCDPILNTNHAIIRDDSIPSIKSNINTNNGPPDNLCLLPKPFKPGEAGVFLKSFMFYKYYFLFFNPNIVLQFVGFKKLLEDCRNFDRYEDEPPQDVAGYLGISPTVNYN